MTGRNHKIILKYGTSYLSNMTGRNSDTQDNIESGVESVWGGVEIVRWDGELCGVGWKVCGDTNSR